MRDNRKDLCSTYAMRAQLELHVDTAGIFEAAFEFDNVWMIHHLVELDFSEELIRKTD